MERTSPFKRDSPVEIRLVNQVAEFSTPRALLIERETNDEDLYPY